MRFKLRDYVNLPEFYTFLICLVIALVVGFTIDLNGQEEPKSPPWMSVSDSLEMVMLKAQQTPPPAKAEEVTPFKTWKLPTYMQENLQRELDDFNKRFEAKVQAYKKELKTRFKEFADMPNDVILYLEGGFFITRSDLLKLQEQLRDKLTQEVKGDDKTTN